MPLYRGGRFSLLNAGGIGTVPVPANNLVVGVGDSLILASANTAGAGITPSVKFQPRLKNTSGNVGGFLQWAAILPKTGDTYGDGVFRFNGTHCTSGASIATIKSSHIDGTDSPLNDSPAPGTCVVLAGTNDLSAISPGGVVSQSALDARMADITSMYQTLMAANILPIACAVPPTNTANNQPGAAALNAAISAEATRLGIPYADLWTPCQTSSSWTAGYTTDGTHPTVLGAQVMGQTLLDVVYPHLPAAGPNLVTAATDGDSDLIMENGAFERDTGGTAGVPDGGYAGGESATYFSTVAGGCAWSLGARAGYSGQACFWNKTADTADSTWSGDGSGGASTIVLTDGHLYEMGFVMEVASWTATATTFNLTLRKTTDATKRPFDVTINTDTAFTGAIAPFAQFHTFRCNATDAPAGNYRFFMSFGGSGTNTGEVYLGQLTLRDLGVG